jgi:hypothetical protein
VKRIVLVAFISAALVAVACTAGTSSPDPRDAQIAPLLAGNVHCGDAVSPCGSAIIFTSIPNTPLGQSSAAIICGDVVKADYNPNMVVTLGLEQFEVDGGSGNEKLATCDVAP